MATGIDADKVIGGVVLLVMVFVMDLRTRLNLAKPAKPVIGVCEDCFADFIPVSAVANVFGDLRASERFYSFRGVRQWSPF